MAEKAVRWADRFSLGKDPGSLFFVSMVAVILIMVAGYNIGKHMALRDSAVCQIKR